MSKTELDDTIDDTGKTVYPWQNCLAPHKSKPKIKILNARFKPLKPRETQKKLCEVELVSEFWIVH